MSLFPIPGQVIDLTITGPWERWSLNWSGFDLPELTGALRVQVSRIAEHRWIEFRPVVVEGPFAFLFRVKYWDARFVPAA